MINKKSWWHKCCIRGLQKVARGKNSKVKSSSLITTKASVAKILLLGDGIAKNELMLELLREKYQVETSNEKKALGHYIREKSFDLIVLEISDPISEPLAILRNIKKLKSGVKVIVVNNGQSVEAVAKAFECGAADFFRIPLDISLICERIDALVRIN